MLLSRNHPLQIKPCEVKSPPNSSPTLSTTTSISTTTSVSNNSNASSPESAANSGGVLVISTRKPRTPRKRPNQTYNEAAALLSTAYPNLFTSPLPRSPNDMSFFLDPAHHHRDFLLITEKPSPSPPSSSPRLHHHQHHALSSPTASFHEFHEPVAFDDDGDFDAESILDVDEVGIDGILGDLDVEGDSGAAFSDGGDRWTCYGYPIGLGFGIRALRRDFEEANWWRFPTVDIVELTSPTPLPSPANIPAEGLKKERKKSATKKMKKTRAVADVVDDIVSKESDGSSSSSLLLLKLNYDGVLRAWSDKGSPFSEEAQGIENDDVAASLAEIELFLESGGVREASVLRYKEKRRTRLFSKKIRYQVRKVNADQRPRMKGRFVRRPNSKHE